MMKKNSILCVAVASVISIGMLSACGKTADTEQKHRDVEAIEDSSETIDAAENTTESGEDITEETSFGLQDFEGFYSRTETEEMEGFEITTTYGYQFNGDGTGTCYGQDVVDITWNETEIHFADYTAPFVMEPGKLTVDGIEYEKIGGKLITPNPYEFDEDNIENGNYNIYLDENGILETDGKYTLRAEIYTEDTYDIVDIGTMAEGDVIYINGGLVPVNTIGQNDFGTIEINGGIENGGSALRPIDESNCYVYAGMDMEVSFTRRGIVDIGVIDDVKLFDNRDPFEEKEYAGSDAIAALKEIVKEYPLICYDGLITVENGEIVEIRRMYRP